MESLSFVAPYAYSLDLLMLWTDKSRIVTSASPPPRRHRRRPAGPCSPQLPHRELPRRPDLAATSPAPS
jgi:hypothetical protein